MIDLLVDSARHLPLFTPICLCSAAMNLRLSQVVNEPMITVSAALPKVRSAGSQTLLAMTINDPETVAELAAIYPQYETALVNNDIETMQRLFWASPMWCALAPPRTCTESKRSLPFAPHGRRPTRAPHHPSRHFRPLAGTSAACIWSSSETRDGGVVRGRQSQTWVRLPEGWRVVAAHVSLLS